MSGQALFWALAGLGLGGAAVVVLTRDVMRLALALGVFFASLAGLFALFGFGFLALSEIFLYIGGVLVLVLFAIMLAHRSFGGDPSLRTLSSPVAVASALSAGGLLAALLAPIAPLTLRAEAAAAGTLPQVLLGPLLPHFELAGLLLLAALVAVVAVMRSGGS